MSRLKSAYVAFTVIVALGATACTQAPNSAVAPAAVFYNGKIATVNANFDMVEAVAVNEGRIVALGLNDDIQSLASDETQLVGILGSRQRAAKVYSDYAAAGCARVARATTTSGLRSIQSSWLKSGIFRPMEISG